VLSRFLEDPAERHWEMGLRVLKYLKGTVNVGLEYRRNGSMELKGHSDSDWVTDNATGRSTRGHVIYLGENLVCYKSKRDRCVATSTTTAEIAVLYHGVLEGVWVADLLKELGMKPKASEWFCDNQAAVAIINSKKNVDKVRHELVKIQYLRERVEREGLSLEYVSTDEMLADVLTKQLPREKFGRCRDELGLVVSSRSEKWGSVGKSGFSDHEQSQANWVSASSRERGESNGTGFSSNGRKLVEIGASFENVHRQKIGARLRNTKLTSRTGTIKGPDDEDPFDTPYGRMWRDASYVGGRVEVESHKGHVEHAKARMGLGKEVAVARRTPPYIVR
jgi:hypothetical protein